MKVPDPDSGGTGQRGRAKSVGARSGSPGPLRAKPDPGLTQLSRVTARAVADAAIVGWQTVEEELVPIIGQSSVTVLYRRCLISVGVGRTWLPPVDAGDLAENDWRTLHASLSRQTAGEAAEACEALFVEFRNLLGSLIGTSLTEQLLLPVSALPTTGSAEQDTLP